MINLSLSFSFSKDLLPLEDFRYSVKNVVRLLAKTRRKERGVAGSKLQLARVHVHFRVHCE